MSTKIREPDQKPEENQDDGDAGLMSAAQDLITAVQAGDQKGAAQALRAAFQILDSEPHDEGDHFDDEQAEGQE
jgi:hypothetical protein